MLQLYQYPDRAFTSTLLSALCYDLSADSTVSNVELTLESEDLLCNNKAETAPVHLVQHVQNLLRPQIEDGFIL